MWIFLFLGQVSGACEGHYEFSACIDNLRQAIFVPTGNCTEPLLSFPCNKTCPESTFLEVNNQSLVCSECEPGKYNTGGGVLYGQGGVPWESLLENFPNYCWTLQGLDWKKNYNCTAWTVKGDKIETGVSGLNLLYQTELKLYLNLVTHGGISFRYKEASENWYFTKNGEWEVLVDGRVASFDATESYSWHEKKIQLQKGSHEVVFIYQAFLDQNNIQDLKAQISYIKVQGTDFAALKCYDCPQVGNFPGSDKCFICPANYYFENKECKACPANKYSLPGSTSLDSCKEKAPCKVSDYSFNYTGCFNDKRTKHYFWKEPHICDETSGVSLPESEEVDCEPCRLGYTKEINQDSGKTQCLECPSGQAGENCEVCESGTYARKSYLVESMPGETGCSTEDGNLCEYSQGWTIEDRVLYSGSSLSPNSEVWLNMQINATFDASLDFKVEKLNDSEGVLKFYIDGNIAEKITRNYSNAFSLEKGEHKLKWVYIPQAKSNEEFRIHSIQLNGTNQGGAPQCLVCPVGYISFRESASCLACPPGQTSNSSHTECLECNSKSISSKAGEDCKPCPTGTTPNSNHTLCIGLSYLSTSDSTFYVQNLTGLGSEEEKYSLGICSSKHLGVYCYQTFYGPLTAQESYVYLSVLNPTTLILPEYEYLYQPSQGYAFALLDLKDLNLSKQSTTSGCTSKNLAIVNLGQKLEKTTFYDSGFMLHYREGDVCHEGSAFGLDLDLICDKASGPGWPVFQSVSNCTYEFTWRTKFGCKLCKTKEMIKIESSCVEGKKWVELLEGQNCIVSMEDTLSTWEEDCSVTDEVLYTVPVLAGLISMVVLCGVSSLLIYMFCKVRSQYQALIEQREIDQA